MSTNAMAAVLRAPVLEATKDSTVVLLKDEHHPTLSFYVLEQLQQRQQFCDVELTLNSSMQLLAHRIVLAASSPFFMKLFSKNSTTNCFALDEFDIDASSLDLLIGFFYTSKLLLTEENSQSICHVARVLELERIERACCKYISQTLNDTNVVHHLIFAQKNLYFSLERDCQVYIAQNIVTVSNSPSFADHLTITDMRTIFSLDCLDASSEKKLVQSLLAWVQFNPLPRQGDVYSLLLTCDLPQISHSYQLLQAFFPPCEDMDELAGKINALYNSQTESEQHMYESVTELLLSVGGISDEGTLDSVEEYKRPYAAWNSSAPVPRKKAHAGLVAVKNKVYSLGGLHTHRILSDVDIFEPERGKWTGGPRMPVAKNSFGVVYDGHKKLYCIGGLMGSCDLSTVDILNVQTNTWTVGKELQQPRSLLGAAILDFIIYAVGGSVGSDRLATVERLDTAARKSRWERVASLRIARSRPGVAELNGLLFAVGGFNGTDYLASVECYFPVANEWVLIRGMSSPRNSPAVASLGNKLIIAGGHNGKNLLGTVESFDPELHRWNTMPSLPVPKSDFAMCSVIVSGPSYTSTWM